MIKEIKKTVICPVCGEENNYTKKGTRKLKDDTKVQRLMCRKCKTKFTPKEGTPKIVWGGKFVIGKTNVDLDRPRHAKLPGKRTVKHVGKDGKVYYTYYYEHRRNRADVNPAKGL
jgi:rubredoxin